MTDNSLSIAVLQQALPDKYKRSLNQDLLDNINQTLAHPELYDEYRNNFLTYLSVLNDGKYKMEDYLSAVKYVTHKLMGESNQESYIKTFPHRYNDMITKGYTAKEISSRVSIYNKSKLVNSIYEQSMIPTWILNQDMYQKAINVQADLMMNAQSEKVRSDAANSLLIHLKPPEVKKVELDIGVKTNKEIDEMRNLLVELSAKQRSLLEVGAVSTKEVAQTKLIGKVIDHE